MKVKGFHVIWSKSLLVCLNIFYTHKHHILSIQTPVLTIGKTTFLVQCLLIFFSPHLTFKKKKNIQEILLICFNNMTMHHKKIIDTFDQ